jgi:hypothetical protein
MPAVEGFNYVAFGFLLGNLAAGYACYAHISRVFIERRNIECKYFMYLFIDGGWGVIKRILF